MGSVTLKGGERVVYIGDDEVRQGGVAIMMSARSKRALMEWTPISKRIIKARFYSKYKKLAVIQTYAPTNEAVDEEKKEFYNQLQDSISSCSRHDIIVVMGDLNAKVGSSNTNREEVMGKFGVGVMNDNGERLCDFCSVNGLVVTGTIFSHKEVHKLTWRSPDRKTVNQIDHVMVNGRMRTSILETRVMRGADVYSDHYLLRTRIRLKLARVEKRKMTRVRFDVWKLQSKEIRRRYSIEVKNRFEALGDLEDPEEEHEKILEMYRDAAEKIIGRSKKQSKPWIGDKTWKKVKERKEVKLKMEGARSERLKRRWREEYNVKDKEVKQSAREDKRNRLEERAAAAEKAAENGRSRELYNITKAIVGEQRDKKLA